MMNNAQNMRDEWKGKPYEDVTSFALGKQTPRVQERVQKAFRESMLRRIVRTTGRSRFDRVVDLGCATGEWVIAYLSCADRVTGVEINPSFVDEARLRAGESSHGDRLDLHLMNLVDFDEYAGADLVCLGACLMYVDDETLESLFARIRSSIEKGSHLYVRASVAKSFRKSYETPKGFYRRASVYRELFQRHGFRIVDQACSTTVVGHEFLRRPFRLRTKSIADLVLRSIVNFVQLPKQLSTSNDYMNWILRLERRDDPGPNGEHADLA